MHEEIEVCALIWLRSFRISKTRARTRTSSTRLDEILLLCICAVASGAEGWQSIANFGRNKLGWLRGFLPYANGIPSEDCLGWVIARLSRRAFQEASVTWTQSVAKLTDGEVVAIDGKTLRRSHNRRNGQRMAGVTWLGSHMAGVKSCLLPNREAKRKT